MLPHHLMSIAEQNVECGAQLLSETLFLSRYSTTLLIPSMLQMLIDEWA